MTRALPLVVIALLVTAVLYFVLPHLSDVIGWFIGRAFDLFAWSLNQVWSLLWFLASLLWSAVKAVLSLVLNWYSSLLGAYPLLSVAYFVVCFGVTTCLYHIFSRRANLSLGYHFSPNPRNADRRNTVWWRLTEAGYQHQ